MAATPGSLNGSSYSTLDGGDPPDEPPTPSPEDPASPSIHQDGRRGQKYSSVATTETVQSTGRGPGKRSCLQIMNDWWAWEVAGVSLSFSCLAAIIAILVRLDGRPLSVWAFPITPNAMISTFTTLSKVSLITALASCVSQLKWSYFQGRTRSLSHLQHFEDASRGPWGSLIFLWNMKAAAPLTSVVALLIILAMAIEPFAQQVIEFPLSYSPLSNMTAGISNVEYYDSGWRSEIAFNPGMVGAILEGIFGSNRAPQVDCLGGNCEFPVFKSLGVCSKCVNITASAKVSCQLPDASMAFCEFLTPSGISITLVADTDSITPYDTGGSIARVAYTYTHMLVVPSAYLNETAGISFPMIGFGALKFTASPVYLAPDPLPPYEMNECAFYMCEKTYENCKVTDGLASVDPTPGKDRQLHQTPWFSQGVASWRYLSFDAADDWNVVPPQYMSDGSGNIIGDPQPPAGRSFDYAMANNGFNYLSDGLSTIFNTTGTDDPTSSYRPFNLLAGPLWNTTDLDTLFANVAHSLTDYMRNTSRNATHAVGTVYAQQTFVRVRWPWLILQAVAIGVGIVVLLLTIVHTARMRVLVWKSSSLAILLHGIDAERDGDEGDVKAFRQRWAHMAVQRNLSQMEMLSHDYVLRFEPDARRDGDGLGSGEEEGEGKFQGGVPRFVVQEKGTVGVPVADVPP